MTKAVSLATEAASDPVIREIFELVPEAEDEVRIKALGTSDEYRGMLL